MASRHHIATHRSYKVKGVILGAKMLGHAKSCFEVRIFFLYKTVTKYHYLSGNLELIEARLPLGVLRGEAAEAAEADLGLLFPSVLWIWRSWECVPEVRNNKDHLKSKKMAHYTKEN